MSFNLNDFVRKTIDESDSFHEENRECIKQLVAKAIDFYKLKSYEQVEVTELGTIKHIHLHSMIEENLLSKIIEISIGSDKGFDIEEVYEGRVIREY